MMSSVMVNGSISQGISVTDRGLAYGDGIYRTLLLRRGIPQKWAWQRLRLLHDMARMNLPVAEDWEELVLQELMQLGGGYDSAVGKIIVTRGEGKRGYAMPDNAELTRIVSVQPWAGYPAAYAEQGVVVRWCETRLALQPLLAGVKHLNRLENVFARSEWSDAAIHEGLMLDMNGHVIEGTMSNVFAVIGEQLITPRLQACGVAGAARQWVMDTVTQQMGLKVCEVTLPVEQLLSADELFLTNSLMGVCPIRQLSSSFWNHFPLVRQLQQYWLAAG